ncbi:universal stress protein [Virgisporangium ochraceum]|uniref:Universal stress protein n=1 Tax=Virgisporangium ochraceum TaxID=65505 RepID=A0A8J4EED5_9ACTN|nr:universal stress protein [Virgisporangium ochraceum]GIJ72475.1 universal stress protein [Virgisporangium ochraceum]
MNADVVGRPVVVGVDDSPGALDAVRWAARYADAAGFPVRLVHATTVADTAGSMTTVIPGPFGVATVGLHRPRPSGDRLLAAARAEAARVAPRCAVSVRTASDTPVAALVDASSDAALVVVGSNDRNRWVTLFDSVAARVVAAAHSPVVVVRGDAAPAGPVVVAVDDSDGCEPALRFAFLEASRRGCALVAVHAWQIPLVATGAGPRSAAVPTVDVAARDVALAAWRSVTDTIAPWRAVFPDVAVEERLLQGPPDVLVAAETSGAALAVVGSRGRGPVAGLLLGSTSQALIHTSRCPVAVVRDTRLPTDAHR